MGELFFDKKMMLGHKENRINGSSVSLLKLPGSVQQNGFKKINKMRKMMSTLEEVEMEPVKVAEPADVELQEEEGTVELGGRLAQDEPREEAEKEETANVSATA